MFGDNDVKMIWKRAAYFAVGAIFTPFFVGLSIFLLRHRSDKVSASIVYATSAFFCFVALVTASAFRAAFRNPPWWIVSPEKARKSYAAEGVRLVSGIRL
jgi:hypothetical protein